MTRNFKEVEPPVWPEEEFDTADGWNFRGYRIRKGERKVGWCQHRDQAVFHIDQVKKRPTHRSRYYDDYEPCGEYYDYDEVYGIDSLWGQ